MANEPIDLAAERHKREQPDPELIRKDDYGRSLYVFLLHYEMGGKQYGAEVWAYDEADAEARVAGMRESLTVAGKLYSQIPL